MIGVRFLNRSALRPGNGFAKAMAQAVGRKDKRAMMRGFGQNL
jgi:hypothetical protein